MLEPACDVGATALVLAGSTLNSFAISIVWARPDVRLARFERTKFFFVFSDCHESRECWGGGWLARSGASANRFRPPQVGSLSRVESLMAKAAKIDSNGARDSVETHESTEPQVDDVVTAEAPEENGVDHSDVVATVATVAVVGIGAAAFEAALIPGIVLGVAAMWLPQYFPRMGEAINPLVRSTVRGAYKLGHKTKEMMAEAQEQFHDIAAEVHAEGDRAAAEVKSAAGN
jgi:Protein of unknown function (DUF5132)